jgi:hypothetical protein
MGEGNNNHHRRHFPFYNRHFIPEVKDADEQVVALLSIP